MCELVQFQVSPVTRLIKGSEKGQSIQFSLFDKQEDEGFADYFRDSNLMVKAEGRGQLQMI